VLPASATKSAAATPTNNHTPDREFPFAFRRTLNNRFASRQPNRTSATTTAPATRSGWRKPAVVQVTVSPEGNALLQQHPRLNQERLAQASRGAGGECAGRNIIIPQKPVAVASANPNHGGLTPAALGECTFTHRKNRFSPADMRTAIQERGA
jgi:hypothetical protein